METQVLLPTAAELRGLLESLLGRDVTMRVSGLPAPSAASDLIGRFADDGQRLRAVTMCDLAGAAYVGAALALMPKGIAAESIKSGALSDEIADNMREVLNVLSALLNGADRPHVRFVELTSAAAADPDALSAAESTVDRLDISFQVRGYGEGRLALAVV